MRKIKLLNSNAKLPVYQTADSAGLDLFASEEVLLEPGKTYLVSTGIAIELERNEEAQIRPRSGLSLKGIWVLLGTIDADYRGEIKILVHNNSGERFLIEKHNRIAQMVISPIHKIQWEISDTLSETNRNSGGFGSTGI